MKAIGMRVPVPHGALVINTCSGNDTGLVGDLTHWSWANPTNHAFGHTYEDITAVSVEALWQGAKIFEEGGKPDHDTLWGAWRRGKGRRPIGHYGGPGKPLITDPGEARRRIYIPAYKHQIEAWRDLDPRVDKWIEQAREEDAYLRDFDTGQGIDRNGPMSHAWLLIEILEGRV